MTTVFTTDAAMCTTSYLPRITEVNSISSLVVFKA